MGIHVVHEHQLEEISGPHARTGCVVFIALDRVPSIYVPGVYRRRFGVIVYRHQVEPAYRNPKDKQQNGVRDGPSENVRLEFVDKKTHEQHKSYEVHFALSPSFVGVQPVTCTMRAIVGTVF